MLCVARWDGAPTCKSSPCIRTLFCGCVGIDSSPPSRLVVPCGLYFIFASLRYPVSRHVIAALTLVRPLLHAVSLFPYTANPALSCRVVAYSAQRGGYGIASTRWRAADGNSNDRTSTTSALRRCLVPDACGIQDSLSIRTAGFVSWLRGVGELPETPGFIDERAVAREPQAHMAR